MASSADQAFGTDSGASGDKWTRLYAEGYSPPLALAPVYTPAAAPVLIGAVAAPIAPVLTAPAGCPCDQPDPLGGGIVANSPRRPDDGVSAGGGPDSTIGAPVDTAIVVQSAGLSERAPGAAPDAPGGFQWGREIAVGVIATLLVSGLFLAFGKRRKER